MAVITNSICTNNAEVDIQSGTGALSIATKAAATNIVLGNTSSTTGLTIKLGSGGLTIPTLNSYGSLVTTNAGLISDAAAGASGTILISNGTSSLPTYQTLPSTSVPVDGTTILNTTNVHASGSFVGSITTAPVSSSLATAGFATSLTAGSAVQNTTGYNLLVTISCNITSSTAATLVMGVGSTSTPTTNTVVASFTAAAVAVYNFSAIVPNNYYLLVNTTGTIVVGSITLVACAI
jgi:hypothetical protein